MPFIGTQPEVGGYSVLDALTASATASYTLQLNSENFVPNTANQLLVSLNGVIQKPGSSFTVSGSTLTFSSALTSSDSIDFIIAMGEPLLVGVPSDATITGSKLASNIGISTTGNIATTGSGTLTSAGLITASAGVDLNGTELVLDADGDTSIEASADNTIVIDTGGSERARIDSSGNFFVSATATSGFQSSSSESGTIIYGAGGIATNSLSNDVPAVFNRLGNDGAIVQIKKDGSSKGSLGVANNAPFIVNVNHGGINFATSGSQARPVPCDETGAFEDNIHDFGDPAVRWDNIYASNGSIQTSDQNEKQDIASATSKELNVAKKLSALFKTFRWKSKVAEKGDKTRTHTGIIAQEVQSAFSAEGLDASNYGLFCSDTWWEKDKVIYYTEEEAPKDAIKKTRLGVRYPELFSFIFSSIEARLTALESK